MKKIILVSACLALAACNSTAAPDAATAGKDEAAIKQVLKDITSSDSPAKMAAAFAEDGEWIIVGHAPYKGRAEIEKGIAGLAAPGSKIVFDSLDVKEVILFNDHQALAKSVAVYHIDANGKAGPAKRNEFADYLVKSADGSWQIAYEINSDENG